jgi:hypothetical protein
VTPLGIKELNQRIEEEKLVKTIPVDNHNRLPKNKYIYNRKKIGQSRHTLQNPLQQSIE